MSKDEVFAREYNANNEIITLVEHDGKGWLQWSTFVGKKGFGDIPSVASLKVLSETVGVVLGEGIVKTIAPRSDGHNAKCWLASIETVAKILISRNKSTAEQIFEDVEHCFNMFDIERGACKNNELPSSGASDAESSPPTPPQDDDQDKVEDAPEMEVSPHQVLVEPTIKELSDKMDESMEALVAGMNHAVMGISKRIDELEMVKYADQLGDMAERMSNFEEKLYEFKGELADFKLTLRTLKEATGSQIQSESINRLIAMVDKLITT